MKKATCLTRHPCTAGHANLLCIVQTKKSNGACHPCAGAMLNFSATLKKNSNCACRPCAGAMLIFTVSFKSLTTLLDLRTFGRADDGSSVAPLTKAIGGLAGGRRGGDTSEAVAAPSPRCPPSRFSLSRRALAPTPSSLPSCAGRSPPYVHERWTELFVSLCAFCLGFVLDGARCFVVKPTCLCHCLCHGLRAGDKMWVECAGVQSGRPGVITNVKTPFCLRFKGPAEVYADAEMTQ